MNEPGLSFRKHWRQAGEGTQEDLGVTASSSPPGRCRLDGNREEEGSQQQASEGTLGTLGAVRDVKQRRHEKKGHRKLRGNTERTWKARRRGDRLSPVHLPHGAGRRRCCCRTRAAHAA